MDLQDKKRRKSNRDMAIMLIIPTAILGKLIAFLVLPEKYFYDSMRMALMLTNSLKHGAWEGYTTTVNIFRKINVFNLTTREQWSIVLGIVGTLLVMIMISRVKEMSSLEVFFTLMSVGLLNIYAFNIAKEPVQMAFFLCIYIIIILPFNNSLIKIVGCALIFFWESNTFRTYYILMAVMCLVLYVVFTIVKKIFKNLNILKVIIVTVMCFAAMFAFVFASQYVDKKSYEDAINTKVQHKNEGATSAIENLVESDGSFGKFMINYVINAVRMLLPVELLFKSPGYFPFVIYQVFILMYWIRTIKNIRIINERAFLSLICFTAYLFGSFVFEPDFGSWVRHEAASFPVFYIMAYEDLSLKKEEKTEYENQNEEYVF